MLPNHSPMVIAEQFGTLAAWMTRPASSGPSSVWSSRTSCGKWSEADGSRRSARRVFGAQLAAMLGLPYAFASHFAPDALMQALEVYRARFELPVPGTAWMTRPASSGPSSVWSSRTSCGKWSEADLGSSLFGAQLAAMLGLPYAFASHFAPDALMQALGRGRCW
jgi:hypothetical protein